jgi:single-stranded-DNA-specific exonuclease
LNKYTWKDAPAVEGDTVSALAGALDIPLAGATLLAARGISDVDAARRYLNPSVEDTHDPFAFENMEAAVELVQKAVGEKRTVLVHGDYDVDGISGTALLYHYLGGLIRDLRRFVPDRREDGYGIAERAVDWAIEKKVGLFIAVDCGTSDVDLIERLEEAGIPVIVCDHHQFRPDGRYAGVMLNPVREGETYPFPSLCGAGVAYKFVQALHARGVRGRVEPDSLLDLAALATVGDVAPLVGENRYFVRAGLQKMNERPRPGIGAIKTFTRLGQRPITAGHIGFMIAPRINAPGRVSRPKPSLEILCEEGRDRVMQLASTLEGQNERRRELTEHVQAAAVERIRGMADAETAGGFVLAGEDWDEGVLGIAAARVAEAFGRPAILMSVKGEVAKGSGRSIPGVDLKAQLDHFGDRFEKYGGHAQAVGLTMRTEHLDAFTSGFAERLLEFVTPGTGLPLRVDASIVLEDCSFELLSFLARCEPFGYGNREPVWKISDVQVLPDTSLVGQGGHMKFYFQDTRGNPGEAIAFGWDRPETPDDLHGRVVDLAVTIKRGEYNGRVFPELRVADLRIHGS